MEIRWQRLWHGHCVPYDILRDGRGLLGRLSPMDLRRRFNFYLTAHGPGGMVESPFLGKVIERQRVPKGTTWHVEGRCRPPEILLPGGPIDCISPDNEMGNCLKQYQDITKTQRKSYENLAKPHENFTRPYESL